MKFDDEDEEETKIIRKEPIAKKWKRDKEMEAKGFFGSRLEISAIPLSPIHPQEQEKEKIGGEGGEVIMMDR